MKKKHIWEENGNVKTEKKIEIMKTDYSNKINVIDVFVLIINMKIADLNKRTTIQNLSVQKRCI